MLTLNVRKRSTNNCCARNIVKFCIVIADTEISGKSTLFHWTVFISRQRKWRTRRSQSWEGASRTWARSLWRNSTNRRWFRQNQKTWSAPPDQVSQIAKSNYFSLLTKNRRRERGKEPTKQLSTNARVHVQSAGHVENVTVHEFTTRQQQLHASGQKEQQQQWQQRRLR